MIKEFVEGETYTNSKLEHDILVLGIGSNTDTEIILAVLKVDREERLSVGGGELTVKKSELSDWSLVEI